MTRVLDTREAIALLQPGDLMLYKPGARSFFGWLIRIKTWHAISHVEVYVGDGKSFASRDGIGTNIYPMRLSDLVLVRKPNLPFNIAKALAGFYRTGHQPYGWLDLLQFMGAPVDAKGVVCSPAATDFIRDGDVPVFGREPSIKIAPMQLALTELYRDVWTEKDGVVRAARV